MALELAQARFRAVAKRSERFFALLQELGYPVDADGFVTLPPGCDLSKGWTRLESQIEQAVGAGDVGAVKRLCDQYQERAEKFFSSWEARARQQAQPSVQARNIS